jgi:hypothetical protein
VLPVVALLALRVLQIQGVVVAELITLVVIQVQVVPAL